ncbi:sensor histidine kinase [Salipaludibacillus sp. CF4.18]|uniref:sensor histidine kinase n=1 Tax=Salipaludibacillus sp. CF4.18 TaxID=3373081 RepID=UPI003EE5451A
MVKRSSVFKKLFTSHLLILFLSFLIFAIVLNTLIHHEMLSRYNRTFEHQINQIQDFFERANEVGMSDDELHHSLEFNMDQENRQILLFDSEGRALFHPGFLQEQGLSSNIVDQALSGEETVSERLLGKREEISYVMASKINIPSLSQEPQAIVMVFHEFDRESRQIIWINFLTALIALVITAMIIYYTSRKITDPLTNMNHSALQFAKGDFSHRVNVKTTDEIGQLGNTLNHMAKELGSLDQLRKDFVANVSHDLRTPLTSIRGFLGAMLDGTIPRAKEKHYLTIMHHETDRLMKLVNDLLSTASLEAGNWELDCKAYNVTEQLRIILAKLEPETSKREMEIQFDTGKKDVYIYADSERMEQVFINLVQNAIQYSSYGSKIGILVKEQKNVVQINISDQGLGMSEDELANIWERFYKSDKARTQKVGTGIGLSIVKQILDLHNATIIVESNVGQGTTFTLTIAKEKQ